MHYLLALYGILLLPHHWCGCTDRRPAVMIRAYVSRMKNLHVHVDPNRPVAKFPFCTGGAVFDIWITSPLVCSFSKKCAHVQRRYPFFCHDPKSKSTRDPIYRVPTMEYLLTTSCTLYEIHKFCILPGTSTVAGTCWLMRTWVDLLVVY